jgi:hypothetical protein
MEPLPLFEVGLTLHAPLPLVGACGNPRHRFFSSPFSSASLDNRGA